MTMPSSAGGVQKPHIPTVMWAVGAALVLIVLYHLIHRH
jgi:hypothetical protein